MKVLGLAVDILEAVRPPWLVVLALAGCLTARSQPCGDGVCAPGTVCVAALDLCATPGQVAACAGIAEAGRCATGGILVGTCDHGACVSSGCGNGVVEPGEACDDGNTVSGDGCSADCRSTEACGNAIVDQVAGEQCDCGDAEHANPACQGPNSDTGGPCSTSCKLRCGDGMIESDEGCDPSVAVSVSCAGVGDFERGLTTCSDSCQPVITADTCRYIGWRTRTTSAPTTALAPTGAGRGFGVAGARAGKYIDYSADAIDYTELGVAMTAVWAADDDTAVAVGAGGTIARWDPAQMVFVEEVSGTLVDLRAVWGRSASEVYAVGEDTVLAWDGSAWSSIGPPEGGAFRAIAGDDARVYVVGDRGTMWSYDGVAWQAVDTGTTADLLGVWSTGAVVVAVGAGGTIAEDTGSGFVAGRTTTTADLLSVWGSAADGWFASGEHGTVLFDDGRVWRTLALGRGLAGTPDQTFAEIVGVAGVEVTVLGSEDVATFEGAAWSPTTVPTTASIDGLWGSATDDVFAVGRGGTILHHDGLAWTVQPTPTTADLHAVWGTGPRDVYAVGDDLTVLHYDGATWTAQPTGLPPGTTGDFAAVFEPAAGGLFVAGSSGVFQSIGGGLVQTLSTPQRAAWGSGPANVWVAGGDLANFDGSTWTVSPTFFSTRAVAGNSTDDIYSVGTTSLHYYDGSWDHPVPFDPTVVTVSTSTDRGTFAAGLLGKLAHLSDGDTAVEPFVSRRTTDLNAIFITGDVVFMAGPDGALDVMVFRN